MCGGGRQDSKDHIEEEFREQQMKDERCSKGHLVCSHTFTLSILLFAPSRFSTDHLSSLSLCHHVSSLYFLYCSLCPFPLFLIFFPLSTCPFIYLPISSPSFLFFSLKFLLFFFFSPIHPPLLFRPPLRSVCMTHFLGPGPINHSVVGPACLPPCLAALPHHSR